MITINRVNDPPFQVNLDDWKILAQSPGVSAFNIYNKSDNIFVCVRKHRDGRIIIYQQKIIYDPDEQYTKSKVIRNGVYLSEKYRMDIIVQEMQKFGEQLNYPEYIIQSWINELPPEVV